MRENTAQLYIPKDDEITPKWRLMVEISNTIESYSVIEISIDEMNKIISAKKWFNLGNLHFNKNKCFSIIFFTQVKDGNNWVPWDKDVVNKILDRELKEIMNIVK